MKRPENYKTRQRDAILNYIISLDGKGATAAQVMEYFKKENIPVGRTTVYRQLDKLTQSGELRRCADERSAGVCYLYVPADEKHRIRLCIKCEDCGNMLSLECDTLDDHKRRVFDENSFGGASETVLSGKCDHCVGRN